VNRLSQGVIMAVIGATVITATITGLYLNFVKDILKIPLFVAAGILILMGLYQTFAAEGAEADTVQRPGHEVAHDKVSAVGWFLVVPFLVMSVVVPPPLGAYSAQRDSGLSVQLEGSGWGPLPSEDPVELTLAEYQGRALFDESESLRDRRVRLIGFVSSVDSGEGWAITRLSLNCCAADGYALKVDVMDGGERLPDDTWIEATGLWVPTPPGEDGSYGLPILQVESIRQIDAPENPYE
jgi:uncharacterized repeat protein (TIGR03943 family)